MIVPGSQVSVSTPNIAALQALCHIVHEDGPYSNSEMGCLPRVKARCVVCHQQFVYCCPSEDTFRRMRSLGFLCTSCRPEVVP